MVIVYEKEDGTVGVIYPAYNETFTLQDVAQKDVPVGKPYLIVPASEIPADPTYQAAWEVDFSEPDGIGLGHGGWMRTKDPDYED